MAGDIGSVDLFCEQSRDWQVGCCCFFYALATQCSTLVSGSLRCINYAQVIQLMPYQPTHAGIQPDPTNFERSARQPLHYQIFAQQSGVSFPVTNDKTDLSWLNLGDWSSRGVDCWHRKCGRCSVPPASSWSFFVRFFMLFRVAIKLCCFFGMFGFISFIITT